MQSARRRARKEKKKKKKRKKKRIGIPGATQPAMTHLRYSKAREPRAAALVAAAAAAAPRPRPVLPRLRTGVASSTPSNAA